jgi:hypothetical protein
MGRDAGEEQCKCRTLHHRRHERGGHRGQRHHPHGERRVAPPWTQRGDRQAVRHPPFPRRYRIERTTDSSRARGQSSRARPALPARSRESRLSPCSLQRPGPAGPGLRRQRGTRSPNGSSSACVRRHGLRNLPPGPARSSRSLASPPGRSRPCSRSASAVARLRLACAPAAPRSRTMRRRRARAGSRGRPGSWSGCGPSRRAVPRRRDLCLSSTRARRWPRSSPIAP